VKVKIRMRTMVLAAALVAGAAGCSRCGADDAPGTDEAEGSGVPSETPEAPEAEAPSNGEAETGAAATDGTGDGEADAPNGTPTGGEEAAAAADDEMPPPAEPPRVDNTRSTECAFEVHRLVMATAVENREPVAVMGDVSASSEPVYVYAQIGNPDGPETTARFLWEHGGSDHTHEQTMDVGVSPTWRTWVRHRLLPTRAGEWTIRVFDADGCEAATTRFTAAAAAE